MRQVRRPGDPAAVDPEPLITREELQEYLFGVFDIRDNVAAIRRLLEEDDNGWEAEEDA